MSDDEDVLPPGWRKIASPKWSMHSQTVPLADGRLLRVAASVPASIYDPASDRWSPAAPMERSADRRGLVLIPEGWVLATGGSVGTDAIEDCELYDPKRDMWLTAPRLPKPRYGHACVAAGGRAFVIGGQTPYRRGETSVLSWVTGEAEWQRMPDLPSGVYDPKAIVLDDGSILVWGEARGSNAFVLQGDAWTTIGSVSTWSAVVATPDGFVTAGGSNDGEPVARVRAWSKAGWQERPDLPKPREGCRGVRLADGRIAIVGGSWTEKRWEDTSDGGELDIEYRSFMAQVTHNHPFDHVLVADGDGWREVPAPGVHGSTADVLKDGRVIVSGDYIWTP